MISWRFYFVFAVIFYSKSVLSCYDDEDCPSFETCCDDSFCRSDCPRDNSGVSSAVLIVIIIFAVVFKVVFWIAVCYCRRRRYRGIVFQRFDTAPRTAVVVNSSSTQSQMINPVAGYAPQQQGYNPQQQPYNPPQQAQQGSPGYGYPQNKIPNTGDVFVNPANNPPPYTDSPQS